MQYEKSKQPHFSSLQSRKYVFQLCNLFFSGCYLFSDFLNSAKPFKSFCLEPIKNFISAFYAKIRNDRQACLAELACGFSRTAGGIWVYSLRQHRIHSPNPKVRVGAVPISKVCSIRAHWNLQEFTQNFAENVSDFGKRGNDHAA